MHKAVRKIYNYNIIYIRINHKLHTSQVTYMHEVSLGFCGTTETHKLFNVVENLRPVVLLEHLVKGLGFAQLPSSIYHHYDKRRYDMSEQEVVRPSCG